MLLQWTILPFAVGIASCLKKIDLFLEKVVFFQKKVPEICQVRLGFREGDGSETAAGNIDPNFVRRLPRNIRSLWPPLCTSSMLLNHMTSHFVVNCPLFFFLWMLCKMLWFDCCWSLAFDPGCFAHFFFWFPVLCFLWLLLSCFWSQCFRSNRLLLLTCYHHHHRHMCTLLKYMQDTQSSVKGIKK